MSPKPKQNVSTEAEATPTQAATGEVSVGNSAPDEEIRRRAYEIYLVLNAANNKAASWTIGLQAERELEQGGAFARASWLGMGR